MIDNVIIREYNGLCTHSVCMFQSEKQSNSLIFRLSYPLTTIRTSITWRTNCCKD